MDILGVQVDKEDYIKKANANGIDALYEDIDHTLVF